MSLLKTDTSVAMVVSGADAWRIFFKHPKLQVVWAIVCFVPVFVVNVLARFQVTTKRLFHNKTVLSHGAICLGSGMALGGTNPNITTRSLLSPSLKTRRIGTLFAGGASVATHKRRRMTNEPPATSAGSGGYGSRLSTATLTKPRGDFLGLRFVVVGMLFACADVVLMTLNKSNLGAGLFWQGKPAATRTHTRIGHGLLSTL